MINRLKPVLRHLPGLRTFTFLAARPSWPGTVERPAGNKKLGVDFDTDWARRPAARAVRAALIEGISRPSVTALATPTIVGLDRLDNIDQPVIFAANHSSHIDTSLVLSCLPPRFRHNSVVAAGADYFFDKRLKATLWSLWVNVIPIERERVGRRSAELASRLLDEGWNLVIFPEGTRSRDGYINPFRGGAAYLGIRNNVPVVPVHLEGTRRIFGVGAKRLTPGPTRVTIGKPLTALPGEKGRDFNVRIEAAVAVAADEGRTDWWTATRRAAEGATPTLQAPETVDGWRRTWMGSARVSRPSRRRWPL